MYQVTAYTTFNTEYNYDVKTLDSAREYAKRIITEGLWISDIVDGLTVETFLPVHQVVKVKVEELL